MQADARAIDVGAGGEQLHACEGIAGEIVVARSAPVAGGNPGTALVVDERCDAGAGETVGDVAVGAPARFRPAAVQQHHRRVRPRRPRQAQAACKNPVAVAERYVVDRVRQFGRTARRSEKAPDISSFLNVPAIVSAVVSALSAPSNAMEPPSLRVTCVRSSATLSSG